MNHVYNIYRILNGMIWIIWTKITILLIIKRNSEICLILWKKFTRYSILI